MDQFGWGLADLAVLRNTGEHSTLELMLGQEAFQKETKKQLVLMQKKNHFILNSGLNFIYLFFSFVLFGALGLFLLASLFYFLRDLNVFIAALKM